MISLQSEPLEPTRLLSAVASTQAGAVSLFLGTVREFTGDRQTLWLDYAAYEAMALPELQHLEAAARQRWPLVGVAIAHRLGRLELGEASVAIAVSSAHRKAALDAVEFLIDELKIRVPIWKQEHWSDGSSEWVHPGTCAPDASGHDTSGPGTSVVAPCPAQVTP